MDVTALCKGLFALSMILWIHIHVGCENMYINKHIESPAALSCIQMGYLQEMVQKAIDVFIARNRHCNFKGVDLCEILFDMEENPEAYNDCSVADSTIQSDSSSSEYLELLREENERLKENNHCKVCVVRYYYPSGVVFLPCGHMICCPQCTPAMKKCPICSKSINGPLQSWTDSFEQQIKLLNKYDPTTVDSTRRDVAGSIFFFFAMKISKSHL